MEPKATDAPAEGTNPTTEQGQKSVEQITQEAQQLVAAANRERDAANKERDEANLRATKAEQAAATAQTKTANAQQALNTEKAKTQRLTNELHQAKNPPAPKAPTLEEQEIEELRNTCRTFGLARCWKDSEGTVHFDAKHVATLDPNTITVIEAQ